MKLPKQIETHRLIIRPFVAGDREAFVSFMTDEETTTAFMFSDEQKTDAGARTFFDRIVASYASDAPYFVYAITRKGRDGFIGTCGLSSLPEKEAFECFVCLSPESRGKAYGTEAVESLMRYCFASYPINEFRVYISPENPRSIAIARRLGMRNLGPAKHPVHGDPSERYSVSKVRMKFGDDYVVSERTFTMGIDWRFTAHMAKRFAGRRVLETCTGAGFTTIALAREAAHVITVEIDPAHQAQARDNVEKAGMLDRVTFVAGDVLDERVLKKYLPVEAAFLDPDWAQTGPQHVYRFRPSNTRPPADVLLEMTLALTPHVAIVLPPLIDVRELDGLPPHERQSLYMGENHELYCLYFGSLARSSGETDLYA